MPELTVENNKTYTLRTNLKNWEHNNKNLTEDKFLKLIQDRKDLIDLGPLLVMPEDDHFVILGGNQRNLADETLSREKEWIQVIDFAQGEDGKWYVLEDGQLRTDKRGFSSKFAAMKFYSYKHNSVYGGYTTDGLASDMANPELAEIDWSEVFAIVGDPKSFQDFVDKVAPQAEEAIEEIADQPSPIEVTPTDVVEEDRETELERFENRLVVCPDCGCKFDPKKHRASGVEEEDVELPSETLS